MPKVKLEVNTEQRILKSNIAKYKVLLVNGVKVPSLQEKVNFKAARLGARKKKVRPLLNRWIG